MEVSHRADLTLNLIDTRCSFKQDSEGNGVNVDENGDA